MMNIYVRSKRLAGVFHVCSSPTSGLQAHFTFAAAQQAACRHISRLQQPNKRLAGVFHVCSDPTSGLQAHFTFATAQQATCSRRWGTSRGSSSLILYEWMDVERVKFSSKTPLYVVIANRHTTGTTGKGFRTCPIDVTYYTSTTHLCKCNLH